MVRMENGVPRYGDESSERYLVQEIQQLHAVHTKKCCYLAQEIVERVRSRGQVHRRLMPLRVHAATPPAPGAPKADCRKRPRRDRLSGILAGLE